MQLVLSNLLDLALGSENFSCENYNALHTLLHILLKKLNLADTLIELSDEPSSGVENLLKDLPDEPAICFKEYYLKPDGCKVKKKSQHVCAKKSITCITKKWPTCTPQRSKKELKIDDIMNQLYQTAKAMNCRITKIEKEMANISAIEDEEQNIATESRNCALKINVRKKIEENVGSDSDSHDDVDQVESRQINCLKQKILELSNSLAMHSNCLKRLKCEEIPKMKSQQQELLEMMSTKMSVLESKEKDHFKCLNELIESLKNFKTEILCINQSIQKLQQSFCDYKKEIEGELCDLQLELVKNNCKNAILDSNQDLIISEIIDTQNLQHSSESLQLQIQCKENQSKQSLCSSSDSLSKSEALCEIKKQISSQNVCLNQLLRDISRKVDRCELEVCIRELNDISDAFAQLKKDMKSTPVAAGCTVPLMQNLNCISCQANANMTMTTTTIPKLPSLNLREHKCTSDCLFTNDSSLRTCNGNRNYHRRSSEGYTKMNRRSTLTRTKYRRISTPYKCSTPLSNLKNRYRKSNISHQC